MDVRLIRELYDVTTRAQLASEGVDRWRVRNAIAARRWQAYGRAVVLHNGPLTPAQALARAVLAQPQPCALAGRTALAWHGLRGFEPSLIDVAVPHTSKGVGVEGVNVHRTRRSPQFELVRGLPCVVVNEAVAQAVEWEPHARRACGLAASVVQQRLGHAEHIAGAVARARPRHHELLRRILGDIAGGAESMAEVDFAVLAARAGLPPPIRQARRRDARGRWRYLDADFGPFAVEVDGGLHLRAMSAWDDMDRQNELAIGGKAVLRFSSYVVRAEPDVVIDQLRRMWDRAVHRRGGEK